MSDFPRNIRDPDPIMAKAALTAIITREHRLEELVRSFMAATEGVWIAAQAEDAHKARISFELAMEAHKAAGRLLNPPPEPPQAA